jgi:hypothetical protein
MYFRFYMKVGVVTYLLTPSPPKFLLTLTPQPWWKHQNSQVLIVAALKREFKWKAIMSMLQCVAVLMNIHHVSYNVGSLNVWYMYDGYRELRWFNERWMWLMQWDTFDIFLRQKRGHQYKARGCLRYATQGGVSSPNIGRTDQDWTWGKFCDCLLLCVLSDILQLWMYFDVPFPNVCIELGCVACYGCSTTSVLSWCCHVTWYILHSKTSLSYVFVYVTACAHLVCYILQFCNSVKIEFKWIILDLKAGYSTIISDQERVHYKNSRVRRNGSRHLNKGQENKQPTTHRWYHSTSRKQGGCGWSGEIATNSSERWESNWAQRKAD